MNNKRYTIREILIVSAILGMIAFWCGIGYIAWHFIAKLW